MVEKDENRFAIWECNFERPGISSRKVSLKVCEQRSWFSFEYSGLLWARLLIPLFILLHIDINIPFTIASDESNACGRMLGDMFSILLFNTWQIWQLLDFNVIWDVPYRKQKDLQYELYLVCFGNSPANKPTEQISTKKCSL